MTKKLFLEDSYLKECVAKVTSIDPFNPKKIELNQTIFYPQGGGQPCDVGTITRVSDNQALNSGNNAFKLLSVKNEEGKVVHEVDKEGLCAGDNVKCVLDWGLRFKHMRMHTSAHILATVLFHEKGTLITGNQLGAEESRMDFAVKDFDRSFLKSIEDKVNKIVEQDLPISISFEKREQALARPELFRLKDLTPKDLQVFRLLEIVGFDVQADGGTHVHRTSEVGKITITDLKNKGAQNRRIYWKLE